jgi:hypothetical protein
MPSPGGQAKGMTEPGTTVADRGGRKVWHPLDLPEGYRAAPRRQS